MSYDSNWIKSHITIEEAEAKGLIQIARQLKLNEETRKGLGLRPLQDEIENPIKNKQGRPTKSKKIRTTEVIRTNFNTLHGLDKLK